MRSLIGTCAAVGALAALAGAAHGSSSLSVHKLNAGFTNVFQVTLNAGDTFSAMTTPLRRRFDTPDTMMAIFDLDDDLIFYNDDGMFSNTAFFSYRSSILYTAPESGTYKIAVTGFGDFTFSGAHPESGRFAFTSSVLPVTRGVFDFGPGDAIPIVGYDAALGAAYLDDDVHTYTITLNAGDILNVLTTPLDSGNDFDTPDTIVGIFDSGGNLLHTSHDGPDGPNGSSAGTGLAFHVATSGDYTIKVSGFDDFGFIGAHTEVGAYAMTVSVIPTPGAWSLLGGLAAFLTIRRRRAC